MSNYFHDILRFVAAALMLLAGMLASPATAAPVYQVRTEGQVGGTSPDVDFVSGASTVETSSLRSSGSRFGQARAKAGPGGLLAFTYIQGAGAFTPVGSASRSSVGAQATATLAVDDLVISSPIPEGIAIATNLNVRLRGVFSFDDVNLAGIIYDQQDISAYVTIDLPGPLTDGSGSTRVQGSFRINRRDGVESVHRSGLLGDLFGVDVTNELGNFERRIRLDANIVTPDFFAAMNTPLTAGITLEIYGSQGGLEGFGVLSADFEHTLTFAPDRPVFNLPDGYSANSASAGIVDNRFVPEPSSLTLLALGSAAVLLRRRRLGRRPPRC